MTQTTATLELHTAGKTDAEKAINEIGESLRALHLDETKRWQVDACLDQASALLKEEVAPNWLFALRWVLRAMDHGLGTRNPETRRIAGIVSAYEWQVFPDATVCHAVDPDVYQLAAA